jgi:hypothetical protein
MNGAREDLDSERRAPRRGRPAKRVDEGGPFVRRWFMKRQHRRWYDVCPLARRAQAGRTPKRGVTRAFAFFTRGGATK